MAGMNGAAHPTDAAADSSADAPLPMAAADDAVVADPADIAAMEAAKAATERADAVLHNVRNLLQLTVILCQQARTCNTVQGLVR